MMQEHIVPCAADASIAEVVDRRTVPISPEHAAARVDVNEFAVEDDDSRHRLHNSSTDTDGTGSYGL